MRGDLTPTNTEATCEACRKSSPIPDTGVAPGVTIGRGYRIEEKIGAGSLGEALFIARQENMDRQVQVGILPPSVAADPETFSRFKRQVKLMASLAHPSILTAMDAGEDNGAHFLVTQYETGEDFEAYLAKNAPLPEKQALGLLADIASALECAWREKQILHRNIKPQNIFITTAGRPMLTDLGIAKSMETDDSMQLTGAGFAIGTPEYMSPEQCRAEADLDFRSDLYSLGIVLYEALTGATPFTDKSPLFVMQKQMDEPPPPISEANPKLSPECVKLVGKMLAKDRADRYPSWGSLITVMQNTAAGKRPAADKPLVGKKDKKPAAGKKRLQRQPNAPDAEKRGLSRGEVEKMAREMYSVSPVAKLLLYAFSILIAVGIVIIVMLHNNKKRAKRTPAPATTTGQSAITPATADRRTGSPAGRDVKPGTTAGTPTDYEPELESRKYKEMYDYALEYVKSHPTRYNEAIRKMTVVSELADGTKYALMADDLLADLEKKKEKAVERLLANLAAESAALVNAEEFAKAAALYKDYGGPLAADTLEARTTAAAAVAGKGQAFTKLQGLQESKLQEALTELRRNVGRALLQGQTTAAMAQVKRAAAEAQLAAAAEELGQLQQLVEAAGGMDAAVLDSFKKDQGKTITIRLATGSKRLLVERVEATQLRVAETIREGGSTGRITSRLRLADLSLEERLERQPWAAADNKCLAAILAVRAGRKKQAADFLRQAEDEMGKILRGLVR